MVFQKVNDIVKNGDDKKIKSSLETVFKSWKPGDYKLKSDKMWTYRLTDNKEWEAKTSDSDYINLKTALTDDNYKTALEILKDATKI